MPALPDAAQVIRADYLFRWAEDVNLKCREFFKYTGSTPTDSDLNALAITMNGAFNTHFIPLMYSAVVLQEVNLTDLTTTSSATGGDPTNRTGTRSGHGMDASNCVLLSQQIRRRYRGGHSRMYLPFGVQEDLQDAQTWNATFVGQVQSARAAFLSEVQGALPSGMSSFVPCQVSYYSGFTVHTGTTGRARNVSTPRTSSLVDLVTAEVVKTGIAVIRKRLLGLA